MCFICFTYQAQHLSLPATRCGAVPSSLFGTAFCVACAALGVKSFGCISFQFWMTLGCNLSALENILLYDFHVCLSIEVHWSCKAVWIFKLSHCFQMWFDLFQLFTCVSLFWFSTPLRHRTLSIFKLICIYIYHLYVSCPCAFQDSYLDWTNISSHTNISKQ